MSATPASLAELLGGYRNHVLLRVIAGSQAYGLAMPSSDTDERGIFVLPPAAHAALREPADHLQDERGDVVYYSLRKFLGLAMAANPSALELLYSPADCLLFCAPAAEPLLAERAMFVTKRCVDSHVGYARAQIHRARGQNKWINNPQPVEAPRRESFCHVIVGVWPGTTVDRSAMPLRPQPLATSGIDLREYHCAALEHVPRTYRLYHYGQSAKGVFRNGQLVCESIPKEHEWSHLRGLLVFDEAGWEQARRDHTNYWQWREQRNEARWRTQEAGEIDYDAKNLMHTFRLLGSAEAILREGQPRVRFDGDERTFLLRVRAGALGYDELIERAQAKIDELLGLAQATTLPAAPDADAVEELQRCVTHAWQKTVVTVVALQPSRTRDDEAVHGVTAAKRQAIIDALADLSRELSIRILHACESGSRAWGFESVDSDYDVRFLYARECDWYLRVRAGKDSLVRMLPGALDLAGWDLRKALGLFASSNAALFEHLGSAIVYGDTDGLLQRLRTLVPEFFNPIAVGNHYLGLARKMCEAYLGAEQVNVKKLFYVLRPIAALQWIEQRLSMPPTRFDDVLAGSDLSAVERTWIGELQAQKVALREVDAIEFDPRVRAWIDDRMRHFESSVKALPYRGGRIELLDAVLAETLRS